MSGVLKKLTANLGEKDKFKQIQHKYRNRRFKDPDFKSEDSSVVWERAEAFVDVPSDIHIWDQGRKVMDIIQSQRSQDSWLAAAMVVVGPHHWLLKGVVPDDQGFLKESYTGAFHFFFWRFGDWQEVIIDDSLPTVNGLLASTHFRNVDEMWPAMLEKAYLKLLSGPAPPNLDLLSTGTPAEALTDMTGGLCEVYSLEALRESVEAVDGRFFDTVKDLRTMKGLMVMTAKGNNEAAAIGLHPGMHYALVDIKKLPVIVNGMREFIRLLKLKECTGNYTAWKGMWYQESPEWFKISSPTRDIMTASAAEMGEFWLTPEELLEYFEFMTLCHVRTSDNRIVREVINNKGKWSGAYPESSGPELYCKNPQYHLHVRQTGFDHVVSIMQIVPKTQQYKEIGFQVYKVPSRPNKPLGASYFPHMIPETSSRATPWTYKAWREVSRRYRLETGHYIIVPAVQPGAGSMGGEFLLRVFAARKEYGLGHIHEVLLEEDYPEAFAHTKAENIFLQHYVLFKSTPYMDALRLHGALTNNFPQEDDELTLDECHHIIFCRRPAQAQLLSRHDFVLLYTDMCRGKQTFQDNIPSTKLMDFNNFVSAMKELHISNRTSRDQQALTEVFDYLKGDDGTVNNKEFMLAYCTLYGYNLECRNASIPITNYINQVEDYVEQFTTSADDNNAADTTPGGVVVETVDIV